MLRFLGYRVYVGDPVMAVLEAQETDTQANAGKRRESLLNSHQKDAMHLSLVARFAFWISSLSEWW